MARLVKMTQRGKLNEGMAGIRQTDQVTEENKKDFCNKVFLSCLQMVDSMHGCTDMATMEAEFSLT